MESNELPGQDFDVLTIGGGAIGLACAVDEKRGVQPATVDQGRTLYQSIMHRLHSCSRLAKIRRRYAAKEGVRRAF